MTPGKLPEGRAKPEGNAPPRDANESELWAKFSQIPRPLSQSHIFRAKGREVGTLVFRVLTSGELTTVYVDSHKECESKLGSDAKGSIAYEEVYVEEKGIRLVQLACRQPDAPEFPVFTNPRDVRENMTDDEIGHLLASYSIFRREIGPMLEQMTPEEMEAWIQMLARGASRFPLGRCTSEVLMDLLMYAVSKLSRDSSTATSSAGAPPDESSTPSPSPDVEAPSAEADPQ